jgi:GrpB-like predicted nucleotidyltransferase (UPF0157 family)
MSLGLKRGTVKLVPYKSAWSKSFKTEKQKLQKALGNKVIDVQHIGSTSIKGIKAKPIIDIGVGFVKIPKLSVLEKNLKRLGYSYRPNGSHMGRHLFFAKGPESKRTHYLHVSKFNGKRWKNDLKFRDTLNSNKALAKQYDSLKFFLAKQFGSNRKLYTRAKDSFIKKVIKGNK